MNLFLRTRALTEAREDHLTEFFGAALAHVPAFRQAYASFLLEDFATRRGWKSPVIENVSTQEDYAEAGARPDLILDLADGKRIAVEHKLDALETLGSDDDERGQLERYLDLPIDGLAYVRRRWLAPGDAVLASDRYIRPAQREHFLWSDFFHLLGPGQHLLVDWLREGFEYLGFTPPNPNVGELTLRPAEAQAVAMDDFAKLWGRTKSAVARLGFRVTTGSKIQLYLDQNPQSLAVQVFVSPESKGDFLVRFTPDGDALDEIRRRVTSVVPALPVSAIVSVAWGSFKSRKVQVLDVRASPNAVIGMERRSADEIEKRLQEFAEPLIRAVLRQPGPVKTGQVK